MILVTGASGTVGKAVLMEVARAGEKHRAMYRSKEEAAKAPAGTEAVVADFSQKASLAPALRGVESVYLVCSPIPDLVQLEENAIEASVEAGVRRIVLNSALGAGDYGKFVSKLAPKGGRQVESHEDSALYPSAEQLSTKPADLLCTKHSRARSFLRGDGKCTHQLRGRQGHCGRGRKSATKQRARCEDL